MTQQINQSARELILVEALRAVQAHVQAGSDERLRRNALASLHDAAAQLPETDPLWKKALKS